MLNEYVPGEVIEYNGAQVKTLKNGALQDIATGRIVRGTPDVPGRITSSEQAREMLYRRWHGSRQAAAVEAVRNATGNDAIETIDAADSYMLKAMIEEVVLDSDTRADHRVKAWQAVLEQSGMDGKAPKQSGGATPTEAAAIGAGVAAQAMQYFMQMAHERGLLDE